MAWVDFFDFFLTLFSRNFRKKIFRRKSFFSQIKSRTNSEKTRRILAIRSYESNIFKFQPEILGNISKQSFLGQNTTYFIFILIFLYFEWNIYFMQFTLEQTDVSKICQNPEIPLWYISPDTNERTVPVRTRILVRSNILQTHFWNQQKCWPLLSTPLLSIHERRSVSTSRALFLHTRSQSQTVLLRDLDSCDLFVCSDWIAAPSQVMWTVSFAHVLRAFEQQRLKLIFFIHESSTF